MSAAREEKARSEARVEAARARRDEVAHMIATEIGCTEAELFGLAQVAPGDELPPAEAVEKRLDGLKGDRERLGGVNLRAEEELNEILASKTNLATEHADLTEAIRRLRQADSQFEQGGPRTPACRVRRRPRPFQGAVHDSFRRRLGRASIDRIRRPARSRARNPRPSAGQEAAGHDAVVRRRAGA